MFDRMNQVDIKEPAYLAVEIHLAALNAVWEQCARADLDDRSGQPQAIRLNEPSNADTISDL